MAISPFSVFSPGYDYLSEAIYILPGPDLYIHPGPFSGARMSALGRTHGIPDSDHVDLSSPQLVHHEPCHPHTRHDGSLYDSLRDPN